MKAVCIGHSTYDITLPVEEYPKENFKYRIKDSIVCGGGPASNGAYLLAKWGMDTTIMSVVGNDYYGDKILQDFAIIGANTKYLEQRKDHSTSSSYIIVNMKNGSRTIITSKRNPIRKLSQETNVKADLILVDGEHPETAIEVLQNNKEAISILDAGRLNEDTKAIGKLVTYIVCSKSFAEEFAAQKIDYNNQQTIISCYDKLKEYFNTNIVITLEEFGSFTKINNEYKLIPSVKVEAKDTTGAGDIFHGAFTYFIGNNYSLYDTIRYSSITSAISVTRVGSRLSIPSLEEVLDYDHLI